MGKPKILENIDTIKSQLADIAHNVKAFGAKGDGIADDTIAIQEALNLGGIIFFPKGTYLCDTLIVNKRSTIFGVGTDSIILSKSTGAALQITPNVNSFDNTFWQLRDFKIKPQTAQSGTFGIEVKLNAGAYFSNFEIDKVYIDDFGSYGLKLNNEIGNMNGFFTGTIRRCWIQNGIDGHNIGDSITISENTITGRNTGVIATCTSGASQLVIRENNITTVGGAIALINPSNATIENNQCEHQTYLGDYAGAYNSMVYLENANYCKVISNNVNPAYGSVVAGDYAVRINGGNRSVLRDNVITQGEIYHIGIVGIGHIISESNSFGATALIEDLGIGTYGIKRNITLQNNWVEYDATSKPTFIKLENGTVIINGVIKSGTTTSNTILFTLPTGFIPPNVKRFSLMCFDGTTYQIGVVYVNSSGNVTIIKGVNGMFSLDGVTFSLK